MKSSSAQKQSLRFSVACKLALVSLYALTFYFAPVFSGVQKQETRVAGGENNNILIALFNDNFEFGDY